MTIAHILHERLQRQETVSAMSIALQDEFLLAVDLGTSGCKCALVDKSGIVQSWAFRPVTLHIVDDVGAEQDPQDWWQAFLGAARELIASLRGSGGRIAAICCSCQGECTVPVDRNGTPLQRALSWLDMRGAKQIRRRAGGRLFSIAGYDPIKLTRWIRRTGGAPALSGKDPSAHMAFLQETRPEIYSKTYKFLNALDYMNFRLTGRFTATVDSILTSWVTDNRDASRIHYDRTLIRQSGIDADKFPEIVACTDRLGTLSPQAAQELGLPLETQVIAGAVDNSAAAVGSGAVRDREAHIYVGTSSWIGAHVSFKKTDLFAQIASVPCAIPERYMAIGLQTSAGSNLSFLKDRMLFPVDELNTERPEDPYFAIEHIASSVPAGARGLLYTPWLFGERTPVDDSTLRAGFLNLSLRHSRADMIRSVLEGVALNTRWMLKPFNSFLGKPVEQVTLAGGGATSDLWCQIFADVLKIPVRQLQSPIQTNAIGAAFIGFVGIGALSFEEIPRITQIRRVYLPQSENAAVYDELFSQFKFAYRRLAPLYRKMNRSESGQR
jgi:xylulokinase